MGVGRCFTELAVEIGDSRVEGAARAPVKDGEADEYEEPKGCCSTGGAQSKKSVIFLLGCRSHLLVVAMPSSLRAVYRLGLLRLHLLARSVGEQGLGSSAIATLVSSIVRVEMKQTKRVGGEEKVRVPSALRWSLRLSELSREHCSLGCPRSPVHSK